MLYLRLLVAALFASVRARRDLVLENLALRHQLAVYTRGRRRPRLRRHDRRLWSLLARGWSFNDKLRDECLNRERFDTLLEARVLGRALAL